MRRFLPLWILIFCFEGLFAQFTRFKRLTTEEGLPSITVYAITQDKNGFIWAGTDNGICKYDGYRITAFPYQSDTAGISAANVSCLLAGSDDKLWIGFFKGGMNCLDLKTYQFTHYNTDSSNKNSIASEFVKEIIELDKNTLAISTSKGLNLFNRSTGVFRLITHSEENENSLLSDNIRSLEKDKDGSLWISHQGKGITHYYPGQEKFVRYTVGNDSLHLSAASVRDMLLDSDGLLWISLWNAGINVLNTKTGIFYSQHDSSAMLRHLRKIGLVFDIYEDSGKHIWFATAEEGLTRYNKKTKEKIIFRHNPDDPESIGDNTAMTVMEDRTGVIWTGTWRNGLNYFDKKSLLFGYFKHESNAENTLVNNHVSLIMEEEKDRVLIGTGASISVFNPSTKTFSDFYINEKDPFSLRANSSITDIAKDHDGSLWIGTNGGGLYHFYPEQKKYRNYVPKADTNTIGGDIPQDILIDKEGNVWVTLFQGGISLYNRKKDNFSRVKHLPPSERNISSNKILDMVMDREGIIWLGTESSGVIRLDPKTKKFTGFYNKTKDKSAQGLGVVAMKVDKSGFIWLATDAGLLKLNPNTGLAESYDEKNPALRGLITGILEDHSGNLWLLTKEGLIRYNPRSNTATEYHPVDGLQGREFYSNSGTVLSNGYVMAGGLNGFNYFNPSEIIEAGTPPQITFTDFNVENKPHNLKEHISFTKHLTLSYQDYFFSIGFAAMDFASPGENQFKYKLEGFNDDWVDIGDVNSITFTNLDPGDYVLKVKASNSNGVWTQTPLELGITITPPFWRTKWFYALCVITGMALIYGFIKYREKQLIIEKNVLEQKVAERTEELNIEKLKVEEAHKDIKDSIMYAKRIQNAILAPEKSLQKIFAEGFILFKPKDIVSGDFYWILHIDEPAQNKNIVAFATADCTGHGVPGAFMSMLNSTLLNQTAYNPGINTPADALNFLNKELPKNLKASDDSQNIKDGMDIAFCLVDLNKNILRFCGANNPCWIVRNKELIELKPVKQAITASEEYPKKIFDNQEFSLQKNDCIYIFTDGYADQFGGPKGKKFKYKTLGDRLIEINHEPLSEQSRLLEQTFMQWKGDLEQVDDVCIIGVRV